MLQPPELQRNLPIEIANGVISTTTKVWNILNASKDGNIEKVKQLVAECPDLIYAQYNYAPPIHFAVREGHTELVNYLLQNGAHNPGYRTYPFLDSLQSMAEDRGHHEIVSLLNDYAADSSRQQYKGDNGGIDYQRTELEQEFERTVDDDDLIKTETLLKQHPELARSESYFWGEGILAFAAKENNRAMIDLLVNYGATVPRILKWTQSYYFKHDEGAAYILEKGMSPDTVSWQHVTILHDMAQKGNVYKAELLIKHGAAINTVDEEYQSTPLGMAARWGHEEMVKYLLQQGVDPNKAGASWATPLAWARKKGFEEIEKVLADAGGK